jgi:hypothetical protein
VHKGDNKHNNNNNIKMDVSNVLQTGNFALGYQIILKIKISQETALPAFLCQSKFSCHINKRTGF